MNSRLFRMGLLLVLAGGFLLLLRALHSSEPRLSANSGEWREAEEDVHVEGIHFKEWKQDALQWDLDARLAKYYHGAQEAFFEDVSLRFRPPETGSVMTLHADRVLYEMEGRLLRADGNVWGVGEQGLRFHTNSLTYDLENKRVESSDPVVLEKDGLTVEGTGMEGSLRDQRFRLLSSVRSVWVPVRGAR